MVQLSNSQFKNYIDKLTIVNEKAFDEFGNVCTVYPEKCESEFELAIFEGDNYQLTESQKEQIVSLIDGHLDNTEATEEMTSFEFYANVYN